MRYLILILLILITACNQPEEKSLVEQIRGNWIVLYPREAVKTRKQEEIYTATQDSFTGIRCLKLLKFDENGGFRQLDSVLIKGQWSLKENDRLQVTNGGRGFEPFKARFDGYDEDGNLKLAEQAEVRGEKIPLIWYLKKIEGGEALSLFEREHNKWRYKAEKEETESAIRDRLVQMLRYYAVYFRYLSKESSYFIPGRIILPLNFYRHGIGLKNFNPESLFNALFFNEQQAEIAHYMLKGAISMAKFRLDTKGDSFTAEYAEMLDELALRLETKKIDS
ncbi:MAG: hypothetical protein IAE96_09125 [Chitinophagaceae bacterium]|nr:hypothetical protein [Chitinophagaceae bacterium]